MTVAKSKNAKTGFKVFVADASGNYTKDNTSKISFEIAGILSESEKADLKNQISQLQGNLGSSMSQVTQLTKQIQTLSDTVKDQTQKLKQKDEQTKKTIDERKQLEEKLANTEKLKDKALLKIQELSNTNKRLLDELSKNPRVTVK